MKKDNNFNKNIIIEKYYQSIRNFCISRLHNNDLADDISNTVVEIFLKEWSAKKNPNAEAWLIKTADNKINEYIRSAKRKKKYEETINNHEYNLSTDYDVFDTIDQKYNDEIFDRIDLTNVNKYILNQLSEEAKMLYKYLYIAKIDENEIIKKLSISKDAFNMRKTRLNKKIKLIVKDYMETN